MRPLTLAVTLAAALTAAGCGYPGGPLTPLANIPNPVINVAGVQRGSTLIVHGTIPSRTTENQIIREALTIELRVGPAAENFKVEEWAMQAKLISDPKVQNGIATYQFPATEWTGKEVVIAMRTAGKNGKPSNWSNYVVVPVVAAPETPAAPALETTSTGVHVTWNGRGNQFRIFRRAGNEPAFSLVNTIPDHEWTDTAIEYGTPYTYHVQSLVDIGNQRVAESQFSPDTNIVPADKFPPVMPHGLHADPSGSAVSLGWDANTEPDLGGYRIYRSTGDGAMQKLADSGAIPSYSDATVEPGKTYHYAVSAVDRSGNEGPRSATVDVTL